MPSPLLRFLSSVEFLREGVLMRWLPAATDDPAILKAAYRFFANNGVRAAAILTSHVQSTRRRMQAVPRVLAVQDTTSVDWTHHPATIGLGPLVARPHQGVLAHTTLALTPAHVPLGLLAQQVWARDPLAVRAGDHTTRPIDEKESQKWLTSLDAATTSVAATVTIHIGKRAQHYSVIAWRMRSATILARSAPNLPCTVLLDDDEWQALYCRIDRVAVAPTTPPTLRQTVRWIAQLGGFLGRKRDGEPGVTVLWKGLQHLVDITVGFTNRPDRGWMPSAPTPHSYPRLVRVLYAVLAVVRCGWNRRAVRHHWPAQYP